jgi:hypothetical protein
MAASPHASSRPVVLIDPGGIVAGRQAARFMVMTRTAGDAVLRRVNGAQGWAVTVADVEQAFPAGRDSEGPDAAAIVVDGTGQVVHGADVLRDIRRPTSLVVLIEAPHARAARRRHRPDPGCSSTS